MLLGCHYGVKTLFTLSYSEMDDAHQSNVQSAITKVIPELPASMLDILEETLQSLGVETTDDFQFIQEADLLSILRPIQAWKQTSKYISTKYISMI